MNFKRQRNLRNDFSDAFWKSKLALNRRDGAEAAQELVTMRLIRDRAEALLIPDDMFERFDADIASIEKRIAGHDDAAAA